MLLLLPAFVDQKRVAAGREEVPALLVLIGETLHKGKLRAFELAHPPARRQIPDEHLVSAGASNLRAIVTELHPRHCTHVSGHGAPRVKDVLAVLVHRAEAAALAVVPVQAENLPA